MARKAPPRSSTHPKSPPEQLDPRHATSYRAKNDAAATHVLENAPAAPPGSTPPSDNAETPPTSRNLCEVIRPSDVSYQFNFRYLRGLMDAAPRSAIDAALDRGALTLAGSFLEEANLLYAADLRFLQVWRLISTSIGDLSAVVALAPGEVTTLSIKKTQRTAFTRQELESSESMRNLENTQIDKDVLNVARSTTKTNQWHVDATATVSLAGLGSLSVSAGYGESTSDTSSRSLERVTEATRKSSEQLKTLQKTEVTQTSEETTESVALRRIKNPYRDRSLMLNVFDLQKKFQVTTSLAELRPSVVLEIPSIRFDREFVLANADFLQSELLDGGVLEELRAALQVVQQPAAVVDEGEATDLALKALEFLFERPEVVGDGSSTNWDIDASLDGTGNALDDAVGNHLGVEYTTLLFYWQLYQSQSAEQRRVWAIRMAIGLSESINPGWIAAAPDNRVNVLDSHNPTEVMRRISGFISIVDKLLKPLLSPSDEARQALDAAERANFVIGRVVQHLGYHRDYYVHRFLDYVYRRSEGLTLMRLFQQVLEETGRLSLLTLFDPAQAFVDGNRFIVPSREAVPLATGFEWAEETSGGSKKTIKIPEPRTQVVVVPTDGVHIEPAAGQCHLTEVPEETVSVRSSFQLASGDAAEDGLTPGAGDA